MGIVRRLGGMIVLFYREGGDPDLLTVGYIWLTCPLVTPSCLCWAPLLTGQPPFSPPSSNGLPPALLKKLPRASALSFFFQTVFTFTSAKGPSLPILTLRLTLSHSGPLSTEASEEVFAIPLTPCFPPDPALKNGLTALNSLDAPRW